MRSSWLTSKKRSSTKTSCPKFILQDNNKEFKNELLMSVFDNLGIKCIYRNLHYPKDNSKIENIHNLLKHTIVKFTFDSQLAWDNALTLATYCYNITPSVDDLKSPFYLVHTFGSTHLPMPCTSGNFMPLGFACDYV